jgi:glycogen phosphorylase
LSGCPVWLRTWQVPVGKVELCLLDGNDLANLPAHRGMAGELHGDRLKLRLKQEMVLRIGGWQLLDARGVLTYLDQWRSLVIETKLGGIAETGIGKK